MRCMAYFPSYYRVSCSMVSTQTSIDNDQVSKSPKPSKLHSTNPLERLNKEVKRRADVVGIFPNEAAIIRLIGAVLLEQNDEWQLQQGYVRVEAMAELVAGAADPCQIPRAA
jgi:transposase-like protein